MTEKGDGINITLWNTCQKNETCSYGLPGQGDTIFDQYTVNGTCVNEKTMTTKRFAGEECDSANTCFVGDCTAGKCPGQTVGTNCTTTIDCNAGYYCNATSLCNTQLTEGATCVSTWDCANNYGCFDGKCTAWGSKAVDTDLGATSKWEDTLAENVAFFCELGEAIVVDGSYKCSKTTYAGTTAADNKTGFATCNWGDDCNYSNGNQTYTVKCQCGYNAAGQGYCPLASGSNLDLYKKGFSSFVSAAYNNKCHSENRFNCYIAPDAKLLDNLNDLSHKTVKAHLFYDAVSCASDVLGSAFINMSVALLAVLVAFLF